MTGGYILEKRVWEDSDFDRMGWHDSTVYGFVFGPGEFELSLDIDYIFQWVDPEPDQTYFRFWIAPCTLVFENVHEIAVNLEPWVSQSLSIATLSRSDPRSPNNADFIDRTTEWHWTIDCQEGEITLRSVGFKQFVRRTPVFTKSQSLTLQERGGISFERGDWCDDDAQV